MRSPLYKGRNNSWLTQSLFYDMWVELIPSKKASDPVFAFSTDREVNGKPLINCKKTFVEVGDLTGYEWAMKYLESYDHFLYLMQREWFAEQVDIWKNELHTKLKAAAIRRITEISASSNEGQALAASKYLAEKGWEKSHRGRPSKAERDGEMKRLTKIVDDTDEDAQRIGLTLIPGGKV